MDYKIRVGLFGLGTVGLGLYKLVKESVSDDVELVKIAVKNPNKPRRIEDSLLTFQPNDILENDEINTIVELIDDHEAAYHIVQQALSNGKHVITANKRMLAHHIRELADLAVQNNVALLYEGSVCGSIPVLKNMEDYYAHDHISSITGIFNGSSNFILTKMYDEGLTYESALQIAQERGFAESDPSLDVQGWDALYKTVILSIHAFGLYVAPKDLIRSGIQNLRPEDIAFAKSNHYKIKPLCHLKITDQNYFSGIVMPGFVKENHPVYIVNEENNAVLIDANNTSQHLLVGKGAGSLPTGAAVYADLMSLKYNFRYQYFKLSNANGLELTYSDWTQIYISRKGQLDSELYPYFKKCYEIKTIGEVQYLIGKIQLNDLMNNIIKWEDSGHFISRL